MLPFISIVLRGIPEYVLASSFFHSGVFGSFPLPPQPWTPDHVEFLLTPASWQLGGLSSPQLQQTALSQPGAVPQEYSFLLKATNIIESEISKLYHQIMSKLLK